MTSDLAVAHGVYATYITHDCRCPDCRRANTEYSRAYRAVTPTTRRYNALVQRAQRMAGELDGLTEQQRAKVLAIITDSR